MVYPTKVGSTPMGKFYNDVKRNLLIKTDLGAEKHRHVRFTRPEKLAGPRSPQSPNKLKKIGSVASGHSVDFEQRER